MAIISFWSNEKSETGKTSSAVAITTYLAIHHNYKILILDTKHNDYAYQDCYWKEDKTIKQIVDESKKTNIASGISGVSKAILSNKTSPEIITNYTRIVFKDRLEILTDTKVQRDDYELYRTVFKDIAQIANKYYDFVIVDMDSQLDEETSNGLLKVSDLVVNTMTQKLRHINNFMKVRNENSILKEKPILTILGRYDKNSKYSAKNVSRYIKDKFGVGVIPYNTLFFEACNEGEVDDFFIKFRKINSKDKNAIFIEEVKKTTEKILYKLQELRMRI